MAGSRARCRRRSVEQRGGAGGVGGGAVEVEVGSLQRPGDVVLGEPAAVDVGSGSASATTRPPIEANHAGASGSSRVGVGVDGDQAPAGAVDVVERPAVDGALHEQAPGVRRRRGGRRPPSMPGSVGRLGELAGRPAAAIASSRAAASAGSGTQMTLPSSIENSIAWRALGQPLLLVGVEQRVGGAAVEHEVELPGQVGGVADARRTCPARRTAASGGRRRRRGAPGRRATARRSGPGTCRRRGARGGRCRGARPTARAAPRPAASSLSSSSVSCGQAHELPAPPAGPAGHRGGRPGRVADLEVDRIEHARLVEDDVDDEPVVEEPEVVHGDAEQVAHGAVGAVAADGVAGPHRRRRRRRRPTTRVVVLRRGR